MKHLKICLWVCNSVCMHVCVLVRALKHLFRARNHEFQKTAMATCRRPGSSWWQSGWRQASGDGWRQDRSRGYGADWHCGDGRGSGAPWEGDPALETIRLATPGAQREKSAFSPPRSAVVVVVSLAG